MEKSLQGIKKSITFALVKQKQLKNMDINITFNFNENASTASKEEIRDAILDLVTKKFFENINVVDSYNAQAIIK